MKMNYHASPNVVSIAAVCGGELRESILRYENIRNETLNRCMAIPSYKYKSLKWKNRYYDYIRKIVEKEMGE